MVRAFLGGWAPGRAYLDAVRRRGCVVAMNYSFVFFGGVTPPRFQELAIRRLRREQTLHVVWKAGRGGLPHGPAPDEVVHRLEFRRRTDVVGDHLDRLRRMPPGIQVRRIDSGLFPRCAWRQEVVRAVGSTSEFLAHGLGFCAMQGEAIVAEAYSCFWGGERMEIAVITHPDHRGRGLATAVCAHLIQACEALGLSTYWSCDADNEPSLRLATRLGFSDPRPYRLLRYNEMHRGRNGL